LLVEASAALDQVGFSQRAPVNRTMSQIRDAMGRGVYQFSSVRVGHQM